MTTAAKNERVHLASTLKRAMEGTVGKKNPRPAVLDEARAAGIEAANALRGPDGKLAEAVFDELNAELPADLRAWLLELPSFLSKKGRRDQGLELCALLEPLFGAPYLVAERAVVQWEAGDKEAGRSALIEARASFPQHCWPELRSGYVLEQDGRYSEAEAHFDQSVTKARAGDNKKDLRFCYDGLVQFHYSRKNQQKAVELSRKMLEDCPELEQELKVETIRNELARPGRNDPCTCGSGKKWKKCCGLKT